MTAYPPPFPDELLPLVEEFRTRIRRLLGKPGDTFVRPHHLTPGLMAWWKEDGEMGVGDGSQKGFKPILITTAFRRDRVTEWGALEEITSMMEVLRSQMVLDDLAEISVEEA